MSAPASADEPVEQLGRALDATGELVAGVRADQWDAPTPCAGWTARELVNHVVGGNRLFAQLLRGEPMPSPEQAALLRGADHLDRDPLTAYQQAGTVLREAFRQPGVLAQTFPSPVGAVPGMVMVHLRITELLVHGWDLAHATAQPVDLPADLAEQELRFSRGKLADVPAGHSPFGPPQPVSADAPAIDQLAACLGRPIPPDAASSAQSP